MWLKHGHAWILLVFVLGCAPNPSDEILSAPQDEKISKRAFQVLEDRQYRRPSVGALQHTDEIKRLKSQGVTGEGHRDLCAGQDCIIFTSNNDLHFPSPIFFNANDVSLDDIHRLTHFIRPEYHYTSAGHPDMLAITPVLKLSFSWHGPQPHTNQGEKIHLSVYMNDRFRKEYQISRGQDISDSLSCPLLEFCQGHILENGTVCDGGKTIANLRIELSGAEPTEENILFMVRGLDIDTSFALSGSDLSAYKSRATEKMIDQARAAQSDIQMAQRYADLAEHVSIAQSLSSLHHEIERKIPAAYEQFSEAIIFPDAIPDTSDLCITPSNRHLDAHISALAEMLQNARIKADRSHRLFLEMKATQHLKTDD